MLETSYNQTEGNEHDRVVEELRFMEKRMQVVSRAIWFGVASAVVVCMIIGMLFVAGLTKADLALVIAATFVLALALLAGALSYFLREVQISTRTLHVRAEYLELESKG